MTAAPIRILLVDDHPLVRDGIKARLALVPRCQVVAEAGNGAEGLARVEDCHPSLVLTDIGMRDMNGIQLTRHLAATHPEIRVVILSMYDNSEYVASALAAGARGYVLKDGPSQEIVAAIEAVAAGGRYLGAAVSPTAPPAAALTQREREILVLLARGHSNKRVAQALDISVRTAETHRLAIRRKLGVDSPAALVKYAMEHGWS